MNRFFGTRRKDGQRKLEQIEKLRDAYETAFNGWKESLEEKSGEKLPEILGVDPKAQDQLKSMLNNANEKGEDWDTMIKLANSVKEAAQNYFNVAGNAKLGLVRDANTTIMILKDLKKDAEEKVREEVEKRPVLEAQQDDEVENDVELNDYYHKRREDEFGGGRRKRKSKKVKKSKKSKKPKRSSRGKKQIKKTKKYKKRSNKKI